MINHLGIEGVMPIHHSDYLPINKADQRWISRWRKDQVGQCPNLTELMSCVFSPKKVCVRIALLYWDSFQCFEDFWSQIYVPAHNLSKTLYSLTMISITVMILVCWLLWWLPRPWAPGTSLLSPCHSTPCISDGEEGGAVKWIVSEMMIRVEYSVGTLQHFWNNVLVKTLP